MKDFVRIPMLLALDRVLRIIGSDNLIQVLLSALRGSSGTSLDEIRTNLICFGTNGNVISKRSQNGTIVKQQHNFALFSIAIHCLAHKTIIAIYALSRIPIVGHVEYLLSALRSYFVKFPKKALEFSRLAKVMETKGLKVLNIIRFYE